LWNFRAYPKLSNRHCVYHQHSEKLQEKRERETFASHHLPNHCSAADQSSLIIMLLHRLYIVQEFHFFASFYYSLYSITDYFTVADCTLCINSLDWTQAKVTFLSYAPFLLLFIWIYLSIFSWLLPHKRNDGWTFDVLCLLVRK